MAIAFSLIIALLLGILIVLFLELKHHKQKVRTQVVVMESQLGTSQTPYIECARCARTVARYNVNSICENCLNEGKA
jgi:Flp pilus assembly protein protease CpaA